MVRYAMMVTTVVMGSCIWMPAGIPSAAACTGIIINLLLLYVLLMELMHKRGMMRVVLNNAMVMMMHRLMVMISRLLVFLMFEGLVY